MLFGWMVEEVINGSRASGKLAQAGWAGVRMNKAPRPGICTVLIGLMGAQARVALAFLLADGAAVAVIGMRTRHCKLLACAPEHKSSWARQGGA